MLEVSELIYATCKTYLFTQGRFIAILWVFIASVIGFYYGYLRGFTPDKVALILVFSVIGILGSYGVAWFGIRDQYGGQFPHRVRQPRRLKG